MFAALGQRLLARNGVIAGMNTTSDTVLEMDTLLTHGEWLRRMAAALVQDSSVAEDLQQETWIGTWRVACDKDKNTYVLT
jgi:hypothetical protein